MIEIRPVTPDDARELAELHVLAWREAYRDLLPDSVLSGLDVHNHTERWTSIISRGRTCAGPPLCAVSGDRIMGFIVGDVSGPPTSKSWEVASLYVHPKHLRVGIGATLLDAKMTEWANYGPGSCYLWVLRGNVKAIEFYSRFGFLLDGTSKLNYIADTEITEVRMQRIVGEALA